MSTRSAGRSSMLGRAVTLVLLCLVGGCAHHPSRVSGDDPIRTPSATGPVERDAPVDPGTEARATALAGFLTSAAPRLDPWSSFTLDAVQRTVVGSNDRGDVLVWPDWSSGGEPWRVPVGDVGDAKIVLSDDGRRLAVTSDSGTDIQIWDLRSRRHLMDVTAGSDETLLTLRFAPDLSFFVTSDRAGASRITYTHVDAHGRSPVHRDGRYWFPTADAAAVDPDAGRLVNVAAGDKAAPGDADVGGYSTWVPGHAVRQVDVGCGVGTGWTSPDGREFACLVGTRSLGVWDVATGARVAAWDLPSSASLPGVFLAGNHALGVEEDEPLPGHQVRPTLTLYDIADHAVIGRHPLAPTSADAAPVLRPVSQGDVLLYSRATAAESTSTFYGYPVPTV